MVIYKNILGIDAYNIRSGGGVTHILEILKHANPHKYGFEKIILWAPNYTLNQIENKSWLIKAENIFLNTTILKRYFWKLFLSRIEYKKHKIDILLVPGGTYLGSFKPFITINQNLLPFESKEISRYSLSLNFFKFHFLKFLQKKTNKNADGIIFLTKYAMKKVLCECNLENKKSIIIPHGVSSRFNHSPSSRNFIDFKEFTKEFPCKILYISSIELYKHQWVVIDAINFLHENGYKVKLTLVGPHGSGSKKLEKKMQSINPEIVEYLGTASYETIEKSYVNADIGIFASSCETFGMILTEAMSCGLPVAASNMSAIPDVLSDAGLYFNPENSDEIADAIKKLILSSDLRRELANKGYEHVKKFNWINSSNETFCFIEEILMNYKKTI